MKLPGRFVPVKKKSDSQGIQSEVIQFVSYLLTNRDGDPLLI
jgi:hypothetical protein